MKPFDLEAAKRGEPIVTRAGQTVTFIAHVPGAQPGYQVVVLNPGRVPVGYHKNGTYSALGLESRKDLFMAPEAPQNPGVTAVKDKKPFDLKKFKEGAVALVKLRSSTEYKEVVFIAHLPAARDEGKRVVALLVDRELPFFFAEDGTNRWGGHIVMKPTSFERWVNLYPEGRANHFGTQTEADNTFAGHRLGGQAYRIEIEE